MDKKAGTLFVILMVILILGVIGGATAVYLYNFHVFKTIRICISEESQDSGIPCTSDKECLEGFMSNAPLEFTEARDSAPDPIKDAIDQVFDEALYCDTTCKIKNIRGFQELQSGETITSCGVNEKEIAIDIHGKEGIEIMRFMNEQEEKLK